MTGVVCVVYIVGHFLTGCFRFIIIIEIRNGCLIIVIKSMRLASNPCSNGMVKDPGCHGWGGFRLRINMGVPSVTTTGCGVACGSCQAGPNSPPCRILQLAECAWGGGMVSKAAPGASKSVCKCPGDGCKQEGQQVGMQMPW